MKFINYIEDRIPDYALSYLVNNDASGIEDEDKANADAWWTKCADQLKGKGIHLIFIDGPDCGFTRNPAFGLACDCVHGAIVAAVNNEDPREEIDIPGWMEEREEEEYLPFH